MRSMLCFLVACLPVLCCIGCSMKPQTNYAIANLVQASGTVKLDGQPLPNAVITFESTENGTLSFAQTNSSGGYQLQFDSAVAGVTPGKKLVKISTTRKLLGLNQREEGGDDPASEAANAAAVELVPARYNKESELTVDVVPDRTIYDFELLSK
jgi:hypothetical protein